MIERERTDEKINGQRWRAREKDLKAKRHDVKEKIWREGARQRWRQGE